MEKKFVRKPVKNFFIKKDLQIRLIKKIVLAVLIATVVCVAILLLTFLVKYKSTVFYRVTFDLGAQIGNRESIVGLIFPSLLIASIINLCIGICIGLYASRKYAVPIFKLEQWVHLLRDGKLTAQLRFREKEEMRELCNSCNQLSEELQIQFEQIETGIQELKKNPSNTQPLDKIQNMLNNMEFKSEAIEVHTSYLHADQIPKEDK